MADLETFRVYTHAIFLSPTVIMDVIVVMLKAALAKMNQEFASAVLLTGQQYFAKGHVLSIRLSDGLLRGRVKGKTGQIYNIHIDLKNWPQTQAICSCAEHQQCKHAVACFFALQARENLSMVKPEREPELARLSQDTSFKPAPEMVIDADDVVWYSESLQEGHDFFAYQLGILIGDKPVNIVPLVVSLLRRYDFNRLDSLPDEEPLYFPVEREQWIRLNLGRIKPLLRLLRQPGFHEAGEQTELRLRSYQLALMREAEQAFRVTRARWAGTEKIREKLAALGAIDALPSVTPPQGLRTTLRTYQHQGLNWLQFIKNQKFAGILADDMGLGKTIQTLAHLLHDKEQGLLKHASLILAPTSLITNWQDEAARFTPDLKVLLFHGADRHRVEFDDYDVVIATYGLLQRDKTRFLAYPFEYLILDEAQLIKNIRTKTTQIVHQLKANHRLCLTGTPLENHLGELWSLFHFLMPGFLGDAKYFRQFFRIPIEKHHDLERQTILHGRIQSFVLRRTKNQVMQELPLKTEIKQVVSLAAGQRDLYEAIRLSMEKKVREAIAEQGLAKSQMLVLDALLKLRQVCCDPRLLSMPEAAMAHGHSAKLDALMVLLDNLVSEGRRVLVFSQFTSMLALIEDLLKKRQYDYFMLTGQTKHRQALVDRFQAGEVPIFLISLKAGGVGLNLTRADTVVLYDPWWNPAVHDQAASRSHRIGQNNPVFIYQFIAQGTVEEVMLDMQNKKRDLFNSVFANQATHQFGLSESDLDRFFAKIEHE